MHKTKDISKFAIHWQVARVGFKNLKTLTEKLNTVEEYLITHKDIANRERVLNYLKGLGLAYRGEDREECKRKQIQLAGITVSDENSQSEAFNEYDNKILKVLVKDLMRRALKWLDKGYRNKELLAFLFKLCTYLDDKDTLVKLSIAIEESYHKKNTYKFLF